MHVNRNCEEAMPSSHSSIVDRARKLRSKYHDHQDDELSGTRVTTNVSESELLQRASRLKAHNVVCRLFDATAHGRSYLTQTHAIQTIGAWKLNRLRHLFQLQEVQTGELLAELRHEVRLLKLKSIVQCAQHNASVPQSAFHLRYCVVVNTLTIASIFAIHQPTALSMDRFA